MEINVQIFCLFFFFSEKCIIPGPALFYFVLFLFYKNKKKDTIYIHSPHGANCGYVVSSMSQWWNLKGHLAAFKPKTCNKARHNIKGCSQKWRMSLGLNGISCWRASCVPRGESFHRTLHPSNISDNQDGLACTLPCRMRGEKGGLSDWQRVIWVESRENF